MEQTRSRGSNFVVQGSILAIASIISRLIGLVYRIPLNNIIGDEGVGIYGTAYKIYNICLILSCYSIPTAVSRLVAAKMEKKEHRNAYRIFLCALAFGIFVGGIMSLILYFGSDFFAIKMFANPRCALPMRVLAPNILIFAVMGVFRGYYQGKNTMLPTSISQILEQVVNAIVSIVAAYYFMLAHSASANLEAYGAAGGTLGTVIGALTGLLFLVFVFTIYQPTLKRQMRRDRTSTIDSYSYNLRLIVITIVPIILSQAVYQVSGVLDTSFFHRILNGKGIGMASRDAMIGIYTNKYELLTNVPIAFATAVGVAIVPSIVASITNKNYGEVKHKIHTAIKFNMIVAIPSAVGLGVLAKPIIMMLFRSSTVESTNTAATLLQVGSIAVVLVALSTTTNSILQSLNELRIPVIHNAIALVGHLVLVVIMLKFTNANLYAMVAGYILFSLIVCILNWRYIKKKLSYRQEIIKTFVMPFMASVIMGIVTFVVYYIAHKVLHSNSISVILSIVISAIVYFVLLIFMGALNEKELRSLPKGAMLVRLFKKFHIM